MSDFSTRPVRNSEEMRQMCNAARNECNDLADRLNFSARVIKTQLKRFERAQEKRRNSADGKKRLPAFKWRPRAVAIVLVSAAALCRSASRACDKTWRLYVKHYAGEIADPQLKGRTFETPRARRSA